MYNWDYKMNNIFVIKIKILASLQVLKLQNNKFTGLLAFIK